MDHHCNKLDEIWFSVVIYVENRSHSPDCIAMQSGENYLAKMLRFTEWFTAGFTHLAPCSRQAYQGQCG